MAAVTFTGVDFDKMLFSTWFRFFATDLTAFRSCYFLVTGDDTSLDFIGGQLALFYSNGLNKWTLTMQATPAIPFNLYMEVWNNQIGDGSFTLAPDVWHNMLATFDVSETGPGTKLGHVYIDDVRMCGPTASTEVDNNDGVTFPGFVCPGGVLGFPDHPNNSLSTEIAMARSDTQLWLGTYADLSISANREKFYTIAGGVGKPTDPSVAAAAFGTPHAKFVGDQTHFYINGGSGGSATKIGTISDFTPGPSFG